MKTILATAAMTVVLMGGSAFAAPSSDFDGATVCTGQGCFPGGVSAGDGAGSAVKDLNMVRTCNGRSCGKSEAPPSPCAGGKCGAKAGGGKGASGCGKKGIGAVDPSLALGLLLLVGLGRRRD